jgi:hypothetical protein
MQVMELDEADNPIDICPLRADRILANSWNSSNLIKQFRLVTIHLRNRYPPWFNIENNDTNMRAKMPEIWPNWHL